MSSNESEKRKHPRVNGHFIVSYSLEEKDDIIELSQTKNLSQGGIALSTSIKFNPGTQLVLKLRIPLAQESVKIIGQVVESRKMGKNHYDTRIQFVTIDEKYRDSLINTIARQLPPIETENNQKRQYPRVNGHFIVSYSLEEKDDIIELSQTKNLSQGGIALSTSIKFNPGTQLVLKLRIPLAREPVKIIGRVVESRELGKNYYNTRIQFITIDEKYRDSLVNTITHQLKKQ